jgi:mitotic spindle assembly checkpoint protein MAD2
VLAIKSIETNETLERWQFEIHTDEAAAAGGKPSTLVGRTETGGKKKEKTEKEVQGEIREIMKQITSTTTFLPILQEECESYSQSQHTDQSWLRCVLINRYIHITGIHQ